MLLREWAKREGITTHTAHKMFKENRLPYPARGKGQMVFIDAPEKDTPDFDKIHKKLDMIMFYVKGIHGKLDQRTI